MNPRARLAAAVAVAAAVAIAVVALLAKSDGGTARGSSSDPVKIRWAAKPLVFQPSRVLPDDRTATGRVVNDTLRQVRVRAKRLRVVDADGHSLHTSGLFLSTYSHALYPPTQRPPGVEDSTQARLAGEYVDLKPSETAALTVSWRMKPGTRPPLRLAYDGGSFPLDGVGSR